MGGLAGHMRHPHEAFELTIYELKEICKMSLNNEFRFTEKIDGLNMFVIISKDGITFARNKSELEKGGFDGKELHTRFNNERVAGVYHTALKALVKDLTELCTELPEIVSSITEPIIMNVECVGSPFVPNIISYPPVLKYVIHSVSEHAHEDLKWFAKSTQIEVSVCWRSVYANNIIVDSLFRDQDFNNPNITLDDVYYDNFINYLGLGESKTVYRLYERIVKRDTSYNLRSLRKDWASEGISMNLDEILNDATKIRRYVLHDIENIMLEIGTEILMKCEGYANQIYPEGLICQSPIKIYEMMDDYNKNRWEKTNLMMPKFEGVVFEYKGNLYKWTGPFAPINATIGGPNKDKLK